MTESPSRSVRAVARVGPAGDTGGAHAAATPADRSGHRPPTLIPRHLPGRVGPVHVLQLLVAEAVLLGLLAALDRQLVVIIAVGIGGLLLLVAVWAREHGRWWLERRLIARRFRRRNRGIRTAMGLTTLAPRFTAEELQISDDSLVGVAYDGSGWFAVAEIAPTAAMADAPAEPIPLHLLVTALDEAQQPGAALQVLTHTVAAPNVEIQAELAAARSYRELLSRFGTAGIPVHRTTWVSVRLDAQALAEAGAESADQAPVVAATLLRRLVKTLHRSRISIRALDREGLLTALQRSVDLYSPAENGPPVPPHEEWRAWHSGALAHRSYWVRHWPTVAEVGALVDLLATTSAALSSIAFVVVPDGSGDADVRCLIRVAAPPQRLDGVCAAVERAAELANARLFPLDGEQGPATYATAPTGGGPR